MAKTDNLTYEYVSSILDYDPESGLFFWKKQTSSSVLAGSLAGCLAKNGYWVIRIDGVQYKAHRLAFFIFYKKYPKKQIDHINRNKIDNRIINLREACPSQQSINKFPKSISKKSNHRGVSWFKRTKKWKVTISLYGKRTHLGYFKNLEDAIEKYNNFALTYYGEFVPLTNNPCN